MRKTKLEIKGIYTALTLFIACFLIIPLAVVLIRSFQGEQGIGIQNYISMLQSKEITKAFQNSLVVSACAGVVTTVLSFCLAYAVNFTNLFKPLKKFIEMGIVFPMLLPTITYGFVLIYAFGKQGLITQLVGKELFTIYGFNGLLIGYVIYTLPPTFLLMNNSLRYIDKKYIIVSKLMKDGTIRRFLNTVVRPMIGTMGGAFVLAFIMSFTDFGIPASVGGTYEVIATQLYQQMLGAIPNFNNGSVIAVLMLVPAFFSVILLNYLDKFNFHYDRITEVELESNKVRDMGFGTLAVLILGSMFAIFVVMFVTPFVKNWPYEMSFTLDYVKSVLGSNNIMQVYQNSLYVAGLTAIGGTVVAYAAALINTRTNLSSRKKLSIDSVSMVTNSVPGMVLGLSYLVFFNTSGLKGTFTIIILCNIVHFFTTPYLMAKNALSKMNLGWETTGELMGDSWFKTVRRVVVPNSVATLVEMFGYYFVNGMVTVSAIIFLVGARTSVITSKIKELQHYAKFNDIFVLSIIILITNLVVKFGCELLKKLFEGELEMNKLIKKLGVGTALIGLSIGVVGCGAKGNEQVVIYTNSDEEAIEIMKEALDEGGFEGKYILQGMGTSELGGKLMAEGTQIEADLVTMSSYFLQSAQQKHNMFANLTFDIPTLEAKPDFYTPLLANTGAIFVNTELIKENGLEVPQSIKDLTQPEYADLVSIPNIMDSSTAWLLIQAIVDAYGMEEGAEVVQKLVENCGPHVESSGSGPIKKVRAGEVVAGFGLRHQGVADKNEGKPIAYMDPVEGNFSLTEAIAVVKKDDTKTKLAIEMAEVIATKAREELIEYYPVALYEGESVREEHKPEYARVFSEPLTVELLEKHQQFFQDAKTK